MNVLIIISVLAIVNLYLGLYKAKRALVPVTVLGLAAAAGAAVMEWNSNVGPIFSGMMLFDNFAIAFSVITILSTLLIVLISHDYF